MNLFQGKKKGCTGPLLLLLGLIFFPITIGILLILGVRKYIPYKKLKYTLYSIIGLLTFFFGSAWLVALGSPTESTQSVNNESKIETKESAQPQSQATTIAPTQAQISIKPTSIQPTKVQPTAIKSNFVDATFIRVIDGDTIEATINGKRESIRIIGINTPETVDPRKSVECFGREASDFAKQYFIVAFEGTNSKKIQLESDPTQGDKDRYNRLLRYVFTDDGVVDYGKIAIASGYGYEYTYGTPYKYQAVYKQAQKDAEKAKKGLWADNACASPTKVLQPTKAQIKNIVPTSPPSNGGTCLYSCSGPDRDCSDFSSHSQAQSFFNCCGFTANNDPMKLDSVGVGDGVACESI